MDAFEYAVKFVLENEDGFNDDPIDSGATTNFGISLRFLQSVPFERRKEYGIYSTEITADDIINLTVDRAKAIYRGEFWDHVPYLSKVLETRVRNYIFDCCVLHGIAQGIKIAQRATWACAAYYGKDRIIDDGVFGDKTLEAVQYGAYPEALMAERAGFMRVIASLRPKDEHFLKGWLNRAYRI